MSCSVAGGPLTVFDLPLTAVWLSLTSASTSLALFDTSLTLAVTGRSSTAVDLLVVVTAEPDGILNVSSFITAEVVFRVGGGPLPTAGEVAELISSITTVFNGFCVPYNIDKQRHKR